MPNNPWTMDPNSGGGAAGISGPGGINKAAKKKAVKGGGGTAPKTGPGSVYHGWNTPGAPEGGKQWGVWGPLTGGAGGTGGKGGSAWSFLNTLDPSQKQSVFGWLGKNYNPASGQTGGIANAQSLLKSGNYADFLKMVGAGGGGTANPWAAGGGGGGTAPRTSPLYQDPGAGGGNVPLSGPAFGIGGGGGMNAPMSGPLQRGMLPEFPLPNETNQGSYLANLLRKAQAPPTGPGYSRW